MSTKKDTVFLIEDEADILYVYQTALEAAGIVVEPIPSGKDAMDKIKQIQAGKRPKPRLILLDLVLPDINGLEILYALQKNDVTCDIAVFILSNYSSESLHNMTEIKADRYLVKANTSPSQLATIVKEELKKN